MFAIQVHCQVNFGQALYVSGNSQDLGSWNPKFARRMTWSEGNIWITFVDSQNFEYKYFIAEYESPSFADWEFGPNRVNNGHTNITDVWNHRKVLFQCFNPQNFPMFISGSTNSLGEFKKRITMKHKQDISYFRMWINVLEDKEIYYQFHVKTKRNYTSPLQILNIYTTKQYYKNSIICYCEGLDKIKKSIYQLNQNICYGYVPSDQVDYNQLKLANLKTIIEFQNSPHQSTTQSINEEFTYLQVNVHFIKDSNLYQKLCSFINILILKYKSIYICNNSLSHLRKYLKVYEKFISNP